MIATRFKSVFWIDRYFSTTMSLPNEPELTDSVNMSVTETKHSNEENKDPVVVADADAKHITKFRIYKNLIVVSIGSMVVAGTDDTLLTLQSTINSEEGIGVTSIAVQCAIVCLTSLLLPKYLIYKIGSKAVMIIAMVAFLPFFAANYYPTWIVMISSSLPLGVGFSLFWSSMCPYLNDLSGLYASYCKSEAKDANADFTNGQNTLNAQGLEDNYKQLDSDNNISDDTSGSNYGMLNNHEQNLAKNNLFKAECKSEMPVIQSINQNNQGESEKETSIGQLNAITAKIFGFHSMIYQTSYIWSNLLSYYVLQSDSKPFVYISGPNCSCGADYCNIDTDCTEANLKQPSEVTRNILISICIAIQLVAIVVMGMFLETFKPKKTNVTFSLDLLLATLKQTRDKNLLLLIPLTMYTGMVRGFYVSDFTKSYIGCAWGIRHIGLVTVVSGITMAFSSSLSAWLIKHIGMFKVILIGGLLSVLFHVMLLVWKPDHNEPYLFFISSGLYGSLYGIFYTHLRAYFGVLFKEDEEAAFGAHTFWDQIGQCMSFAFSNHICNYVKVYLLIAFSFLGILGYILEEKYQPQERFHKATLPKDNE